MRRRALDVATVLVLLAAAVIGLVRWFHPDSAETSVSSGDPAAPTFDSGRLVGLSLASFEAVELGGAGPVLVDFGGAEPTVLLLFRRSCPACKRLRSTWEALLESLPTGRQAIALAPPGDGVEPFLESRRVRTYAAMDIDDLVESLPVLTVPATFVIRETRIEFAKVGLLTQAEVDTVRALMD